MKKYDHRGNERHTDQDVVSFSLIYVFISDVYCRTGWIVDWDGTLVSITIWRGLLSPRTKSGSLTSLSMIRRRYFLTFITTLIYQLYVFLCCSAAIQQCSTIIKKFWSFPGGPYFSSNTNERSFASFACYPWPGTPFIIYYE